MGEQEIESKEIPAAKVKVLEGHVKRVGQNKYSEN